MRTKEKKVAIPDNNGETFDVAISIKLLYREIPMENPSAHRFAIPNTRAYLVEMLAPKMPAMIAAVVMIPSIPP